MRRVGSDRDRLRVREFFELNLSDRTGFPITTRQQDRQLGIPSILRINEDTAGNIVAAVYASNNPEDVIRWRQSGGNETVAQVISVEMMMIHDLAVLPGHRRSGLGAALVAAVVDDALASGATIVTVAFDDTTPGFAEFYERVGFVTLPRGEQLTLDFGSVPGTLVGFPQADRRYRWAHRVLRPRQVAAIRA